MDRNKLKTYAPGARRDFIKALTEKANLLGLSSKKIEPATVQGDITIIMGKPYPKGVGFSRKKLEGLIKKEGFDQVIERIAYTWFNRFLALRFMELHSYLPHGYRVLSNPSGRPTPEILENADRVDFRGLNKGRVIELKLAGDRDSELYSLLLVAQCNELHKAMPFLFERIDDESELLLPDNLLHTDSVIRKLVHEIPEDDWKEVEIIGWIYQFYISEKKDEVIGKVVKSEDIPAATQLFTPNWIVKYMVQNSLGRKWLATYPESKIRQKMAYYIEPAEQTPEVQAKLKSITPESLNPEEITLLDPACGSGHILVEAYDIFKEIYLERGYQTRNIPRLILEKNLFGLDIDDRAAQLAGFALLMKARQDDTEVLIKPPNLNVMAIQSSENINASEVASHLHDFCPEHDKSALIELVSLFKLGKVAGSLIRVPERLVPKLTFVNDVVERGTQSGDIFVQQAAEYLKPIIDQANLLGSKYDCVVANPPYMGRAYMNGLLKDYVDERFNRTKSDFFAMFIERGFELTKTNSLNAMVTMLSWMFLPSFESMRLFLLTNKTINCLLHLDNRVMNIPFGTAASVWLNAHVQNWVSHFSFVGFSDLTENGAPQKFPVTNDRLKLLSASSFHKIPGSPIAYWASKRFLEIFEEATPLGDISPCLHGLTSSDNDRFLRFWYEVQIDNIAFGVTDTKAASNFIEKWFPHNKGGVFRKWFGNNDYVVNWKNNGSEMKSIRPVSTIRNEASYFKKGIEWSRINASFFGVRFSESGSIYDANACWIASPPDMELILGFLVSKIAVHILGFVNPTPTFQAGNIASLPILVGRTETIKTRVVALVLEAISIAHSDWDSFETSSDFSHFPWLTDPLKSNTTGQSWKHWESHLDNQIERMRHLETENNRLWIEAYGLQDELDPNVPEDQITLARPNAEKDVKRLISYAIGCMMGRYSLDEPGLIYSHSGNIGFDHTRYQTFQADDDCILPITDIEWFPDDVTICFVQFIKTVWTTDTLEENLKFIANSLTGKQVTDSRETIRKYLSSNFFKDHVQTYKNRPIYWLFSSGKQKAFECLVYLHRYNDATLSRMRSEYVIPLQGKINGRIHLFEKELSEASRGSGTKIRKELETLKKKQSELVSFDDKLHHYADMRISLDLDDGVKVNYGKFGDLLAEVTKVTGSKD